MTPVEVTLRSADGLDKPYAERKVVLQPNTPVTIGRSSRNPAKGLLASQNNLFFDSPVISREHAMLEAKPAPGGTAVYITDKASTHGTKVNDEYVTANVARKLVDDDEIQLGADVARNEEFFTAKRFRYSSNLHKATPPATPPHESAYPKGFSVPDDEDAEGSQANPVNIADNDFEDDSNEYGRMMETADSFFASSIIPGRKETGTPRSQMHEVLFPTPEQTRLVSRVSDRVEDESDSAPASVQDSESEHSGSEDEMDYPDEQSGSDVDDMEISDADSDVESSSENEDEDADEVEVKASADSVRRHKIQNMLNHENEKQKLTDPAITPQQRAPPVHLLSSSTVKPVPSAGGYPSYTPVGEPFLSRLQSMHEPTSCSSESYSFGTMQWEAPPRPTAPKPYYPGWAAPTEPATDYSATQYFDFMDNLSAPNMFSTKPALPTPAEISGFRPESSSAFCEPRLNMDADESSEVAPTVDTTAATGAPTPASEEAAAPPTPPQPLRTKVSIAEIVEEVSVEPQQAPTPSSIAAPPSPPALKRKAEEMEQEDEVVVEKVEEQMETVIASIVTSEAEPTPARREKKRKTEHSNGQRSWLKSAVRTTATLSVGALMGGAATIFTLLNAPSSWGLDEV